MKNHTPSQMPNFLKRKRSSSKSDENRPRKRHISSKRLSQIYNKDEDDILQLSQKLVENAEVLSGKKITQSEYFFLYLMFFSPG